MLDPHTEGRRRVLLGNVARLAPEAEVPRVADAIRAAGTARAPAPTEGLSAGSLRVVRAAESEEPLPADEAAALLQPLRADVRALSPSRSARPLASRVFLLHADADPIVPAADAEALAAAIRARGTEVEVHVTDLFGHVNTQDGEAPGLLVAWPLLRFVGRFLDAAED